MCDLFSWIELGDEEAKKHSGRKILFLTDYEVKILRGRDGRKWDADDVVGHSAIEAYYKGVNGSHRESRDKIPPIMAECVKAGKMDGMIEGILGEDRKAWPKYRKDGTRIMPRAYEKETEWILKSIVYFCKNYTIDKKDLGDMTAGAIKTYLGGRGGNVNCALTWCNTPQGKKFWSDLFYLSTGRDLGHDTRKGIDPWTVAEKRKINKMPKVKR